MALAFSFPSLHQSYFHDMNILKFEDMYFIVWNFKLKPTEHLQELGWESAKKYTNLPDLLSLKKKKFSNMIIL